MNAILCSAEKEGPDQAVRYNYSIVVSSDISNEAVVKEMVDVCQIACEKHAAAEKPPSERNNMAAANMIKVGEVLHENSRCQPMHELKLHWRSLCTCSRSTFSV